jgi:endonuclease/exonuclease/phosphatase family metal-dependent hydrolase
VIKRTILLAALPLILSGAQSISVVTLNMAREGSAAKVEREFQSVPAVRDADVLLLQEVKHEAGQPECVAAQLAAHLGLKVAYSPAESGATDEGLAILSRYPIRDVRVRPLGNYDLRFHTRKRFAIAATVDLPGGAVRIFNTHLDTRLNAADRLAQLAPVIRDSAGFAGPAVIGGDFNSNGFYWIGRVMPLPAVRSQAKDVQDYMTRAGFQTGIPAGETTFDYLGMHLDWIWSRRAKVTSSHVYPLAFSDHHAVWTRLQF